MKIELSDITKEFGPTTALDGVDLTIDSGQRLGLVGPNGSGKTTLIRTIMGLVRAQGSIDVGGVDPFDERPAVASKMAYVPQIAPEFRVRVGRLTDAVCRARQIDRSAVESVTRRLDFDLERHAEKPYRDLSGGMKQKLLIGLALGGSPRLLVMDEPTASLDVSTRQSFFELCGELEEATLILCSHRLDEIRHLVDSILELDAGQIVGTRSSEAFVEQESKQI
jgi:ABC-2 type transport system ATP-binding protein